MKDGRRLMPGRRAWDKKRRKKWYFSSFNSLNKQPECYSRQLSSYPLWILYILEPHSNYIVADEEGKLSSQPASQTVRAVMWAAIQISPSLTPPWAACRWAHVHSFIQDLLEDGRNFDFDKEFSHSPDHWQPSHLVSLRFCQNAQFYKASFRKWLNCSF